MVTIDALKFRVYEKRDKEIILSCLRAGSLVPEILTQTRVKRLVNV